MNPAPILVCAHLDERAQRLLRESVPGDQLRFVPRAELRPGHPVLAAAEIAFGNIPGPLLAAAPRLRWMQLESVGFEYYQDPAHQKPGLVITNLKGMFEWPATETALGGLLALARGYTELIPAQAGRRWVELEVRPRTWTLHGRPALVLGAGSIGRRMRLLLEAFECRVQVYARSSPDATVRRPEDLPAAFAASEIVVCCLPKTPATIGLIGRELLRALPPSAVFVNIGRGAVVDEAALVEVMHERRFRGAVVDVTYAEPVPPDHPLWSCPNTIVTQHTGGGYADELLDKARCFLANLNRHRAGQPVQNQVDMARGY
ncbi:MAG: D-2-hydroxyacid dehydrogenase [Opitutaceae bacterium]|nr:D-2-hydroxyacid dehydrogenase [Opitutaceae bacterium]